MYGSVHFDAALQCVVGMSTGVKLGEAQLLFAADMTASAFLRTDINLVQWMADVAGFHQFGGGTVVLLSSLDTCSCMCPMKAYWILVPTCVQPASG
jgi:hypothetical protein